MGLKSTGITRNFYWKATFSAIYVTAELSGNASVYWLIDIDGHGFRYRLRFGLQSRWLRCTMQSIFTLSRLSQTQIHAPHFCIGQESESQPYPYPSPVICLSHIRDFFRFDIKGGRSNQVPLVTLISFCLLESNKSRLFYLQIAWRMNITL